MSKKKSASLILGKRLKSLFVGAGVYLFSIFVIPIFVLILLPIKPFLDPLTHMAIRRHCKKHGCNNIKAFNNSTSYGVTYDKNGARYRGKCTFGIIKVKWLKNDPAEI
jgi:hypothetical protein